MAEGPRSTCLVFIYREGAFSAMGHDLKLEVTGFTVEVGEGQAVRANARTDSLRVVGSLRGDGTVDEREPAPRDRQEIERTIAREILEAERFPQAAFRSTSVVAEGDRYRIAGLLDLHGAVKDMSLTAERKGDRAVARFPLNQLDFRIKPYRAMLGALRVKPVVEVEVSVALPAGQGRS
jgi:hypothetical protein